MVCSLRANHDVSVRNVGSPALGQQRADRLGVKRVKWNYEGAIVLHQAPETHLFGRVPNDLSKSGGGDDNPTLAIQYCLHERENPAIVAIQRYKTTCIEGNSRQAAFPGEGFLVFRFCGDTIFLAQACSFGVSGPPVSIRAWSIMALNSAEFRRARSTACCTKPETLADWRSATRWRISSICSSGSVIVTFMVAIQNTIPLLTKKAKAPLVPCAGSNPPAFEAGCFQPQWC